MNTPNLEQLVVDGVVDEVLQQIKSGKEADVYLVRKGEALLAAKVYKARDERNFKNNAGYLEGRNVRSSRDARAMAKGSRYGQKKLEEAWKTAEVDALYKLHAAGVRVPAPDVFYEGVLVMALVVDHEGYPAPRLADVELSPEDSVYAYTDLLRQVGIMLTCDLIHGDLSPFNVLLAGEGPTIIDLPQVVTAAGNPQAEMFFRRDVRNLHQYFAQFSAELRGRPDGGADLWNRYRRRELFPGYVPDLASLRDDTPIPTFKAKHANRQNRRGRGPGPGAGPRPPPPGPEVVYKGAPGTPPRPASTPVASAPAPAAPAPGGQPGPGSRPAHEARPHGPPGQHGPQAQRGPQGQPGQHRGQQGQHRGQHGPRHGQPGQGQRQGGQPGGHGGQPGQGPRQGGQPGQPGQGPRGEHRPGQPGQGGRPHGGQPGQGGPRPGGQNQNRHGGRPGGHPGQHPRPHGGQPGPRPAPQPGAAPTSAPAQPGAPSPQPAPQGGPASPASGPAPGGHPGGGHHHHRRRRHHRPGA